MTATPYRTQRKTRRDTALGRLHWYGWPSWRVPAKPLREFFEQNHQRLDYTRHKTFHITDETTGWRSYLCSEIAHILGANEEAVTRRLYSVNTGECRTVNVSFAEAAMFAFGLDLDKDTDLPTLPGNMKLAQELVSIRSNDKANDLEVRRHAKTVIRLSALIVAYPHHTKRLQDLAPYDCLRGYK